MSKIHTLMLSTLCLILPVVAAAAEVTNEPAAEILEAAQVHGGLVVVVGAADADLLAGVGKAGPYTVHALDTDAKRVAACRGSLHKQGLYGKIGVQQYDGSALPYVDNLVNLLVICGANVQIPSGEIERVLAPRGVSLSRPAGEGKWAVYRKPVPEEIDEWTHFLHGPDNNALAEDTVVGPPRHVQWHSEPIWGRDHHAEKGTNPTVRTVVSSHGRLFCLIDETETSDMKVPSRWTIVARDAFNGVLLWKKPVAVERFNRRLERVWRQLIADGQSVYAVLGTGQPLSRLDASSGRVVKTYPGTEGLAEVVEQSGTLFVLREDGAIVAANCETGKRLWTWSPGEDDPIVPLTLAATEGKVFVKTARGLSCLAAKTGAPQWRVSLPGPEKKPKLRFPHEKLLVSDGVVLCSYGGKDPASLKRDIHEFLGSHPRVREYDARLGAFSTSDGRQLWDTAYLPNLESAPGEIYVCDGLVWLGPDFAQPLDLRTGQAQKTRGVIERLWTDGHHHRCYPGKATCRYIITAKRGIEMIDIAGDAHSRNNWVRGTCRVGITPCNGLIYAPPHSCGCYMEAKLFGFWALAGRRAPAEEPVKTAQQRLEKGMAYGDTADVKLPVDASGWWTYRGGNERGGSTPSAVPAQLKPAWRTKLGGKLSAVTVARGRVFVAQVDAHTVHALDGSTGKPLWSFIAGGRVDSPPTVVGSLVLFGSCDGYVYCLRASDGELVWRFLASPRKLNTVASDQPESVWPVHGSVFFCGGVVYAAAGRSSHLDGGIQLYGLDPASGRVVYQTLVESDHVGTLDPPENARQMSTKISQNWPDYKTKLAADHSDSFAMGGAQPDILVADDRSLYMRQMRFDDKLVQQKSQRPHLFSTSRLLDGWEHNRTYWVLGTGDFYNIPVAYPWILGSKIQVPHGVMMAFDNRRVWGVIGRRANAYGIFAMSRPDPKSKENAVPDFQARRSGQKTDNSAWQATIPIRPRAMLRAGDLIFFGGMAIQRPGGSVASDALEPSLKRPGRLLVVSCSDGRTIGEMQLPSPPVWDGMAAADCRLYTATEDGSVVCLD